MDKGKRLVKLVDDSGTAWVTAELSTSRLTALVKSYANAGVSLRIAGGE
jgi:hypothetical protein